MITSNFTAGVLHISSENWRINPLSANSTKWSNTQAIRRLLPTNFLIVFDRFVSLVLKGLIEMDIS